MPHKGKSLTKELRKAIQKWVPSRDVVPLKPGGSGDIWSLIRRDGQREACLKIIRCHLCDDAGQKIKLLRELHHLLLFSPETTLPVLNAQFEVINKNRRIARLLLTLIDRLGQVGGTPKIAALLNTPEFRPLKVVVFVHDHGHEHIGFLMLKGLPLENLLEYLSRAKGGARIEKSVPTWAQRLAGSVATTIGVETFLKKFLSDILSAIQAVHLAGTVHLDIKEANIMVLEPVRTRGKACGPRFVLFDFGSARNCQHGFVEIVKSDDCIEATYTYLPKIIQRRNPLSHFTSHNRVLLPAKDLGEELKKMGLDFFALDIHALGCVINNILSDERYRRLAAYLRYKEFEFFYAFAQILSIDFKVYDSDSVFNDQAGKTLIERARALFDNAIAYEDGATRDKRTLVLDEEPAPSLAHGTFAHPAHRLFREELPVIQPLLKKLEGRRESQPQIEDEINAGLIPIRERYETRLLERIRHLRMLLDANVVSKLGERRTPDNRFDLAKVLRTSLFQRLKTIHQLALSNLYPPDGMPFYAQHRRYWHSLGALEIACLYLSHIASNSGWFRLRYTKKDGAFFLLTALLHDIGHYHCTHYLEDTQIFLKHSDIAKALLSASPHGCSTFADAERVSELRTAIGEALAGIGASSEEYYRWYETLSTSIVKPTDKPESPRRLLFRVFQGMISGPIDVDKLHYIVNDSLNCGSSLAAPFEGPCYSRLLRGLRIPVRSLQDSGIEQFCLGLEEDSSHLAQMLIFIRAALFNEIYWSSLSRAATVMLRHILFRCFEILQKCGEFERITIFVRDWIHADTDHKCGELLNKLIAETEKYSETANMLSAASSSTLRDICQCLIARGNKDKAFKEVCRIYPSDRVCYQNMSRQVESIPISVAGPGKYLVGPSSRLLDQIRIITAETLGLDVETLADGGILVDIPMQETSKRSEFLGFALVDDKGFGRQPGHVWDAIEDEFREYSRIIRIFIKPGIVQIDREDSVAIRAAIIAKLS